MATITILEVIRTKRDGGELSDAQIEWFINGYTAGAIADEQAAALCMAVFMRGMSARELDAWTRAMIDTGERVDLSGIGRPTVDKHSTGGVGDKISLPLCPLVAACGAVVPQLSGRGLGHTGGTLDKMESIAGWQARLPRDRYLATLAEVGAVICAAGDTLAPADRRLYALRDTTATVESIPLIASSIMSKKIAEGTSALVLDVKTGSGAFMTRPADAEDLARTMVGIGEAAGVRTTAFVTDMDTPLGHAVGNALEVVEAIEVLQGGGPEDVVALTVRLAREMLGLVGIDVDPAEVLASGRAMDVWESMVRAQGGDPDAPLPCAAEVELWRAPADGVVTRLDARRIGEAAWHLGAGRTRKEDPVSHSAGVMVLVRPGDTVRAGDPVLELHLDDPTRLPAALDALDGAVGLGDSAPPPLPADRVLARITR